MTVVGTKYRGERVYQRVFAELVRAAEYQGVTTYQDIAVIMGLPLTGNHMQRETGQILGEISEDEVEADRPMLSAVAVGKNGRPGRGFYACAKGLGLVRTEAEDEAFWKRQKLALYDVWRRPLRKPE